MTDLITKLEEAGEGSRSLDLDLLQALGMKVWGRRHPSDNTHQWMTEIDGKAVPVPRWTTSLDAALALAERVLPGWFVGLQQNRGPVPPWSAYLSLPERPDDDIETDASTPALALCAAILRASEQERGG